MDNRYQYQTRWVKFGRWLRWRPLGMIVFCWWVCRWFLDGMKPLDLSHGDNKFVMTRGETLKHFWIIRKSLDQGKMEWWYTSDEVFSGLRKKLKDGKDTNNG